METGRELPFHWAAPENLQKEIETRGNRVKSTNVSPKAALHRVQDGEFKVLLSKQGEGFPQTTSLCKEPVEGFPEGQVTDMKPNEMLRSIYVTLRHLDGHFQTLRRQQLDLVSPPSDPLHKKLTDTHNRIQDLAGNIKCLLEEVPPEISITSSSSGRGVFKQKMVGCTVLRKYSEFLKQVVSGLNHVISRRSATRGKGIQRIQKKVLRLG
ncbi:UNVERIFIED_CONTAM: hypothetical protein FKN15_010233 [Acipenser sinensis]